MSWDKEIFDQLKGEQKRDYFNTLIRELSNVGWSVKRIALKCGCGKGKIKKILRLSPETPKSKV